MGRQPSTLSLLGIALYKKSFLAKIMPFSLHNLYPVTNQYEGEKKV